jgi:hypothetical protein
LYPNGLIISHFWLVVELFRGGDLVPKRTKDLPRNVFSGLQEDHTL